MILQWNMGIYKKRKVSSVSLGNNIFIKQKAQDILRLNELLKSLIMEHDPCLIVLQEVSDAHVRSILQKAGYSVSASKHNLITGWKNSVWGAKAKDAISYYRALGIELTLSTKSGIGRKVLVCNVHLSSQLHGGEINPEHDLEKVADELKIYRTKSDNVEEIIIGDFNLEPSNYQLQKETVIHGNRSLDFVAEKENKRPKKEKYRFLYNPSWRLYGAEVSPHGSHYFSGAKRGGPWYILDQAFFSSGLVSAPAKVKMVTEVKCGVTGKDIKLLSKKVSQPDRKKGSDHLPIVWTVTPKI